VGRAIITKSIIVATIVVFLDFLIHENYANPENYFYFLFKLILAFVVAYYMFENKKLYGINLNPFKFKLGSIPYYLNWSIIFAVLHGLYYRLLDWFQGNGFWSFARVGDVRLFHFSDNIFLEGMADWLIIHAGIFLLAIIIVEVTDKVLNGKK